MQEGFPNVALCEVGINRDDILPGIAVPLLGVGCEKTIGQHDLILMPEDLYRGRDVHLGEGPFRYYHHGKGHLSNHKAPCRNGMAWPMQNSEVLKQSNADRYIRNIRMILRGVTWNNWRSVSTGGNAYEPFLAILLVNGR